MGFRRSFLLLTTYVSLPIFSSSTGQPLFQREQLTAAWEVGFFSIVLLSHSREVAVWPQHRCALSALLPASLGSLLLTCTVQPMASAHPPPPNPPTHVATGILYINNQIYFHGPPFPFFLFSAASYHMNKFWIDYVLSVGEFIFFNPPHFLASTVTMFSEIVVLLWPPATCGDVWMKLFRG